MRIKNIKTSTKVIKFAIEDLDRLLISIKNPPVNTFIAARTLLRLIKKEAHKIYRTQTRGNEEVKPWSTLGGTDNPESIKKLFY